MSRKHYKVSTSVVEGRQLQSSVSLGNYERFCTRTRIVGSHVAELVRLRVSVWLLSFDTLESRNSHVAAQAS